MELWKLPHRGVHPGTGAHRRRQRWRRTLVFTLLWIIQVYTLAVAATVSDRMGEFAAAARERMSMHFERAGVAYPPTQLKLVALKREARMDVYARSAGDTWRHVLVYPILAASGKAGPKLREGDQQVPEGIYRIESLNPNSRFHVSLRLDYPNAFDRRMAAADRRTHLGGDIMIHGSNVSVGCLAMGDSAAEDLFTLVADTGIDRVEVVIAPMDLRDAGAVGAGALPDWVGTLYREIAKVLATLPPPLP
jgi:murein L,D-transpeptidase YafK